MAAVIGCGAGLSALPFYSLSSFMLPLEREFGWSRTHVGLASTCLTIGIATTAPLIGRLVDKFGARAVALPSNLAYALCLAGLSFIGPGIVSLYAMYLTMAVLGAGTTPIPYTTAVASWFNRRRGLAFGITLAGTGVTGFLAPQLLASVIAEYGWRAGWYSLSLIAFGSLLLSFFLLKETQIDGSRQRAQEACDGRTLHEALRSRLLWTICSAFFLLSLGISGLIINMVPMLADLGLSPAAAGQLAGMIGVGVIVARLTIGYIIDRVHAPLVGAVVLAITAGGCLLLALGAASLAGLGSFLIGFAMGAEVDLIAFLVSRYFGLSHYGAIFGIGIASFNAGAIFSPILIGRLYEQTGSYDSGLFLTGGLCVVALFLLLSLGPYPRLNSDH